jgi:hypothetical protein
VHAKRASTTSSGSATSTGLCIDWFMDFPLIRCTTVELVQREQPLHKLIPIHAALEPIVLCCHSSTSPR